MASTYSPSDATLAAHSIGPRRDLSQLAVGGTGLTAANPYVQEVIVCPAVLLAVALLVLAIFTGVVTSRCCCACARWEPASRKDAVCQGLVASLTLTFFVGGIFITAQVFAWYANAMLNDGLRHLADTLRGLGTLVAVLDGSATKVNAAATAFNSALAVAARASASCQVAVSKQASYATLQQDSGRLAGASATAQMRLRALSQTLRQARVDVLLAAAVTSDVVYVYFALGMVLCVLLAAGVATRNKCTLHCALALALPVVLTLSIVCCALMAVVAVLGDFCIDPAANFILFLPREPLVQDAAQYYLTCAPAAGAGAAGTAARRLWQGIDVPSQTVLGNAVPVLFKQGSYLAAVTQCYDASKAAGTNGTVPATFARAREAVASINNASSAVSCGAVHAVFVDAVTGPLGVCGATMTGSFSLLVAWFVFSGCVFAAMCSVAVLTPCLGAGPGEADASAPPWHNQPDRDHVVVETWSPVPSPRATKDGEAKHSEGALYSATGVAVRV